MQTFLPVPSFEGSATLLDRQRLGKQRVETLQVMRALTDSTYGWQNHPVTRMWRGFEPALLCYQQAICAEWTGRGYRDTCLEKTRAVVRAARQVGFRPNSYATPTWFGREDVHLSHQANLVRKDADLYGELFPGVEPMDGYIWPV